MYMKELNLIVNIKDELKKIGYWKRLEEEDFNNLKRVDLKIPTEIKDKYNFSSSVISLCYYVAKNFIGYNDTHEIYLLTKEDLIKLIKSEYKVVRLTKSDDSYLLIRKLVEHGFSIIPLDEEIYIKMEENSTIKIKNRIYKTEDLI